MTLDVTQRSGALAPGAGDLCDVAVVAAMFGVWWGVDGPHALWTRRWGSDLKGGCGGWNGLWAMMAATVRWQLVLGPESEPNSMCKSVFCQWPWPSGICTQ